jgi:hypothetical protein
MRQGVHLMPLGWDDIVPQIVQAAETQVETKPTELLATERRSTCPESRLERF